MSLLKPRNRNVIFRLTEEEYEVLRSACRRQGGRSISEFTRQTLLSSIADDGPPVEIQLKEIHSSLQSLTLLVTKFLKPGV